MTYNHRLLALIEASIIAVLAFIFALIPLDIGTGYEAELGMIPIIIFAYRRGWKYGLLSGFIWGLIKLASGQIYILHPLQVFIEYVLAFSLPGLAGILARPVNKALKTRKNSNLFLQLVLSIGLAVLCKYSVHFMAGVIYWSSYAPEGMSPYLYSLIVNGTSALATFSLNFILVLALLKTAPQLIKI